MHAVLSSHMPVLSSGARTLNTSIELSILLTGLFFSQPCHSPYESGNQKWHPALLDRSGVFLGHPAHTAYSKETLEAPSC